MTDIGKIRGKHGTTCKIAGLAWLVVNLSRIYNRKETLKRGIS